MNATLKLSPMTDAPTTRETADHAELARLAGDALSQKGRWDELHDLNKFHAAANQSTVLSLLSEIAALRDYGRDVAKEALEYRRQRDELRKALERIADDVIPEIAPSIASQALANQGADQ